MRINNVIIYCFIIVLFLSIYTGNSIYEADRESGIVRDISNLSESTFVWNMTSLEPIEYNSSIYNSSNISQMFFLRLNNMVLVSIDTLGYITFQVSKMFFEIGYNTQGRYNLGGFLTLIKIFGWTLIISMLFYPALVVGYGIYELIKFIKKHINNRLQEYKYNID